MRKFNFNVSFNLHGTVLSRVVTASSWADAEKAIINTYQGARVINCRMVD